MGVISATLTKKGIEFLWKQAETIIRRCKERKESEVVIVDKPENIELPPKVRIDFDRAQEKATKLVILSEELSQYLRGKTPDEQTIEATQKMIEYIYNQQFVVHKEEKPESSSVDIGSIGTISGNSTIAGRDVKK